MLLAGNGVLCELLLAYYRETVLMQAAAHEGSTAPPRPEDEVNLHFVALVQKHGKLWELDGRKSFPIEHGPSSPDSVLSDAAKVAKQFIAQTDSLSFNLIALAAAS